MRVLDERSCAPEGRPSNHPQPTRTACTRTARWGLLALLLASVAACAPAPPYPATVQMAGQRFAVTVATTPRQWAHGLMGVTHLAPNQGMLFVFRDTAPRTFWMKDTRVPLDMLFFSTSRRLVSTQPSAEPCPPATRNCPLYPSGKPARFVLEVPAGTVAALHLRPGARFVLLPAAPVQSAR